jgi:hypothetical protein
VREAFLNVNLSPLTFIYKQCSGLLLIIYLVTSLFAEGFSNKESRVDDLKSPNLLRPISKPCYRTHGSISGILWKEIPQIDAIQQLAI